MKITITKLTGLDLARLACQYTMHSHAESKMELADLYACEHSPMRTQLFAIEMQGIPNFVSVHFVRHKIGVEHYVQTMREDRGSKTTADRWTLTNHLMIANAQALVNMARRRLCYQASAETREVMCSIKNEMCYAELDLAFFMVPECVYRGMVCHERRMCGKMPGVRHYKEPRP